MRALLFLFLAALFSGMAILLFSLFSFPAIRQRTPPAHWGKEVSSASGPALLWRAEAGVPDTAPLLAGPEGAYAVSRDRSLSAFNWRGRRKWTYAASSPLWPQSLALAGEILFAGARGGWIVGLDTRSGREIWRQKVEGEAVWAPAAEGKALFLATTFAGPGLNGRGKARVYRLDAETGTVTWVRETEAFGLTTPVPEGRILLVGGGLHSEAAGSPSSSSESAEEEGGYSFLAALDTENGEILWQRAFQNGFVRYLQARGDLGFYLAYEDQVCAFLIEDGRTRWCHDPGNWITGMKLSGSGSTLYLGSANGFLVALEASSGRVLWRYDLPGVFNYPLGPPVLADRDRLAFNTTAGEMYVLEASSGRLLGRRTVPRSRASLAAWGSKAVLPSPEGEVWAYSLP